MYEESERFGQCVCVLILFFFVANHHREISRSVCVCARLVDVCDLVWLIAKSAFKTSEIAFGSCDRCFSQLSVP